MNKTCIIIAGPTAVGKTTIAINLAKHFSTQIISADSRQCYKELNIGVAKPSAEELAAVQHYFINSHSVKENLSAADFEEYALNAVAEIFANNDIAVMVGGTGLYIKTFCEGLDEIPTTEIATRNAIVTDYNNNGIEWLQQQIKKHDPDYSVQGEMQNPHRMIRALEVKLSTGKSITSFQSRQKKIRDFKIIKICLQLPRQVLYNRINNRVDDMMRMGLAEEVKILIPFKHLNALQTVGYKELFDYFSTETPAVSLEKTIELIKQNTRHYAKRQITWFKKEEGMQFCYPSLKDVLNAVEVECKNGKKNT